MTDFEFSVPEVSCEGCRTAIRDEVSRVPGVQSVEVDLERKVATVTAAGIDAAAIRAAIEEAGYEVR